MVDFKKKLSKGVIDKKKNPLEIYDTLDRSSVTGPLRPAQKHILDNWFSNFTNSRDLVIKLHTGKEKHLLDCLFFNQRLI